MMLKHFVKAARLRTLPLSVSGIIVGSSMAGLQGYFNWQIFGLAMLTTIGFQVISNFANDYGDGVKGTDNNHRQGPERAIQSGVISSKQMLNAIKITSVITFLIAILLIYTAFGKNDFFNLVIFLLLGIACVVAAIKYTMGKKAYGYYGFGDLFVFVFFGLVSVVGSYYLYVKQINFVIFLPALSIGLLSVGVLNLNNLRDYKSDRLAQKNTLVVKIGIEYAKYYHYYLLIASFLFAILYTLFTFSSVYQFLIVIAFIPIAHHFKEVYTNENSVLLDAELKKLALSTFLFSILFALGNALSLFV